MQGGACTQFDIHTQAQCRHLKSPTHLLWHFHANPHIDTNVCEHTHTHTHTHIHTRMHMCHEVRSAGLENSARWLLWLISPLHLNYATRLAPTFFAKGREYGRAGLPRWAAPFNRVGASRQRWCLEARKKEEGAGSWCLHRSTIWSSKTLRAWQLLTCIMHSHVCKF